MLNLIGDADEFFGAQRGSVAADVARKLAAADDDAAAALALPTPVGHCLAALRATARAGAVAVMKGALHDASLTHDNFERDVLSEVGPRRRRGAAAG